MKRGLEALRETVMHDPTKVIIPLLIFALTFLLTWVLRRLLLGGLNKWSTRTQSRGGAILYEALGGPTLIWGLMLSTHFALASSAVPARFTALESNVLVVLWILSLTLMFMRVAGDLVRFYGSQIPGALPVSTLTQTMAQIGVLVLGVLILLRRFDVEITPILTALGVGGLAVALALQDTLSNLFGGFYIAAAGQVRLGDYIKLNTGEEGYITDIGWRSTTIRALANNVIIVPNSKLSQAIVTNFNLPEKRMGASFVVTVGYDCDLEHVEAMLGEVLKESTGQVQGMLADPAPNVAFDPGFSDNGVGLTVNYQVAEFVNQFGVRNELKRRIYKRFKREGILVPYPSRTLYLQGVGKRNEEKELQPQAGSNHQ